MFSMRTLAAGLLLLALAPTAARADGLITPFWGRNFGGDAGSELSDAVDASRFESQVLMNDHFHRLIKKWQRRLLIRSRPTVCL